MNAAQMKSKCSKTQMCWGAICMANAPWNEKKKSLWHEATVDLMLGNWKKRETSSLMMTCSVFNRNEIPRRRENETRFKRDNQKWGDTTSICIEQMCNVMKLNRESEAIACAHTYLIASYITAWWYCNMVIIWHHPAWMAHVQRSLSMHVCVFVCVTVQRVRCSWVLFMHEYIYSRQHRDRKNIITTYYKYVLRN